jgi:D-alanyl-D-alanine carboxypeptidase
MRDHGGRVLALALVVALAGCAPTPDGTEPAVSVEPSVPGVASASPNEPAASFPTAAFAGISEDPVSKRAAAEFQAILNDMADGAGMSATVMSANGIWSGATGKADGVRDVVVDDQFAIASVTKSLVAAQVMQMVEAGELALDDPATDYLPRDLDFDTNGATIRQLLGHRSGIPDYDPALFDLEQESPTADRQRVWTPAEMLEMVSADRAPAGDAFHYSNPNYLLLGLVIEQVRGRPVADVLRDGVLSIDGVDRLIYQPDEVPTEPMAMPFGEWTANLEEGGGYLPSLAAATVDGPAAAMASDSVSLARWWRAFCAGEIVSEASLTEMTTFHDGYGLGLYQPDPPGAVGHGGEHVGYRSLAGCLPERGVVFVVLSNHLIDTSAVAGPLVDAVRSGYGPGGGRPDTSRLEPEQTLWRGTSSRPYWKWSDSPPTTDPLPARSRTHRRCLRRSDCSRPGAHSGTGREGPMFLLSDIRWRFSWREGGVSAWIRGALVRLVARG